MKKDKMVFVIRADGSVNVTRQKKSPDLNQLQKAVGGPIQEVPHFKKFEYEGATYNRGIAYVNENGKRLQLPFNDLATEAWLECLGDGPFWYEPRLVGDMVFVSTAKD